MAGRARVSALSLPVDARSRVEYRTFRSRTPLLSLAADRMLVTLTLPERLRAEDVEFARRLAQASAAYATEVERLYRGVPSSCDTRQGPHERGPGVVGFDLRPHRRRGVRGVSHLPAFAADLVADGG